MPLYTFCPYCEKYAIDHPLPFSQVKLKELRASIEKHFYPLKYLSASRGQTGLNLRLTCIVPTSFHKIVDP